MSVSRRQHQRNVSVSTRSTGIAADAPRRSGIGIDVSHPDLQCDADLQHLQQLDHQHRGRSTDLPARRCPTAAECISHLLRLSTPADSVLSRSLIVPRRLPGRSRFGDPATGADAAPSTGAITGTPTAAGTFNFTREGGRLDGPTLTATQAQTITIAPGCAPPPTTTTPPTPPTPPTRRLGPGSTSTRGPGHASRAPGTWSRTGSRSANRGDAPGQRAAGLRPGAARPEVRPIDVAYATRSGPPTVRRDQLAAAGSAPDIPRHLPAARQRYEGDRHQPRERGPRPGHRHDRSAARPGLPGGGERPRARSLLRRSRGRRAAISVARRPSGQPGGRRLPATPAMAGSLALQMDDQRQHSEQPDRTSPRCCIQG